MVLFVFMCAVLTKTYPFECCIENLIDVNEVVLILVYHNQFNLCVLIMESSSGKKVQ